MVVKCFGCFSCHLFADIIADVFKHIKCHFTRVLQKNMALEWQSVADLVADPVRSVVFAVRGSEQSKLRHPSRKAWEAQ
jgi:hypothetical protein